MKRVIVYSAESCARCGKARALLERHGIAFSEVNLSKDPDGRAQLVARTGQLSAFRHSGFWHPMDTMRDKIHLEELWSSGRAPWNVWR